MVKAMRPPPLIISCGIIKREIEFIIRCNGWNIECFFLPSTLHFDFDLLHKSLTAALARFPGRHAVVLYGACHPAIDRIVEQGGGTRISCQNCVEMLLGHEEFTRTLAEGSYFLLEEWAQHWDDILERTFGGDRIAREIFQADRSSLVALHTPCSADFIAQAETAAASIGLPLRHVQVPLDHLEKLLKKTLGWGGDLS
ncbi:MAG: DUF1638 domain-containing protein [Desulfuromonadaceae bacterium]|nr:DUF1638 domain-containing protein [Desulfuromonadaceae bacterium]MDD5105553.1 DUF1638 domain-containing protein [Desulfuromonadaceae bacterium]